MKTEEFIKRHLDDIIWNKAMRELNTHIAELNTRAVELNKRIEALRCC